MPNRHELLRGLTLMSDRQDVFRDTHGNLSGITSNRLMFYVKPSGMFYSEICVDDVCAVLVAAESPEDKPVSLSLRKPSVDAPHHRQIYLSCPWVKAICHTHSPYASAYAIAQRTIFVKSTEHADYFGKPIRCRPYMDMDMWGKDVADNVRDDERAILLGGHGTLTFGDDPVHAVKLALALENIAMKTFLAEQIAHGDVPEIDPLAAFRWNTRYNGGGYGQ